MHDRRARSTRVRVVKEMQRAVLAAKELAQSDEGWEPFRPGVEIRRLYGSGGPDESSAALLRYAPGGVVPSHAHEGHEHILVLSGEQSDEHGTYGEGTLIVNPPGSRHRVTSQNGCIVLVIWERPVRFDRS